MSHGYDNVADYIASVQARAKVGRKGRLSPPRTRQAMRRRKRKLIPLTLSRKWMSLKEKRQKFKWTHPKILYLKYCIGETYA